MRRSGNRGNVDMKGEKMKILSIINLKGGVAKTISAVSIAYILAAERGKKVLLVDNDKQGNTSKMLNRHGYGRKGIEHIMTERIPNMAAVIQQTDYKGLDIIPANMTLINANLAVQLDQRRPQHDRIKKALEKVADRYDFCIIDNAPDINISTINALVASDYVMIPVTIDDFALDGLAELTEQIKNTKEDLNPGLRLLGCFVTQYATGSDADRQGSDFLREMGEPVFTQSIRRSEKVKPATFARIPVPLYSTRSAAAADYRKLVTEFMERSGENGGKV